MRINMKKRNKLLLLVVLSLLLVCGCGKNAEKKDKEIITADDLKGCWSNEDGSIYMTIGGQYDYDSYYANYKYPEVSYDWMTPVSMGQIQRVNYEESTSLLTIEYKLKDESYSVEYVYDAKTDTLSHETAVTSLPDQGVYHRMDKNPYEHDSDHSEGMEDGVLQEIDNSTANKEEFATFVGSWVTTDGGKEIVIDYLGGTIRMIQKNENGEIQNEVVYFSYNVNKNSDNYSLGYYGEIYIEDIYFTYDEEGKSITLENAVPVEFNDTFYLQ